MLKQTVPGAIALVFVICLTSFAVALTLGGGPRSTTIELAIYQAFTFEFDLGRAARLAIVQLAIGLSAGLVALALTLPASFGTGLDRRVERWDASGLPTKLSDAGIILISALFLLLPLALITARGFPHLPALPASVAFAALRSGAVAFGSVAIMLTLALPLSLWAARGKGALVEGTGLLLIAASPLVMGTGLFLIVFPITNPANLALPVTALVNAAAALPFALRALVPAITTAEGDYGRLAQSLSIPASARLRLVILPRIRAPLAFSCGLTGALSMGDLGVITLFSGSDTPTLPLMIYRLMGAYRMDAAAGAALLLLLFSFGLFWFFDQLGGRDA